MIWTRRSFDKAFYENVEAMNQYNKENFNVAIDDRFRLNENLVWFKGEAQELERFYKTRIPRVTSFYNRNFYCRVNTGENKKAIYHYNIPNIITKTMSNLLFEKMPEISVSTGNDKNDKALNTTLTEILKANNSLSLFQDAAQMESYSGAVGFKFVLDPQFSDYPILIPYPKEDIEITKKYNRILEIVFKDYYKKDGDRTYTLCSVYGRGYIEYKLYEGEKEVPLNTIPETKDLENLVIYDSTGKKSNQLLAVYKENKLGARSDFEGCKDDFCAYDEVYTMMMDLIEKGHIMEYIPESLLEKDIKTDTAIVPNVWDRNVVVLRDTNYQDNKEEAKRDIPDISNTITAMKEAMNSILTNCLLTAGISPSTVGLDIAGANSSGLALSIREKASIRTRESKITLWTSTLKEIAELLLSYANMKVQGKSIYLSEKPDDVYVKFTEYEAFGKLNDLTVVLGNALDNHLMDLDTALAVMNREFYNMDPEDIEIMKMNIEGELTVDNIEETEARKITEENDEVSAEKSKGGDDLDE